MGTKQARNFGGRPVEREPELGKRTQLNIALPLPLKRKIEQAAKKRGWSISNEAAYRLEMSFSPEVVTTTALKEMLKEIWSEPEGKPFGIGGTPLPPGASHLHVDEEGEK